VSDWGESEEADTTWGTLEACLEGLKDEFDKATARDDWQDVGRRAREIMIDAADLVFEDSMIPPDESAKGRRRKASLRLLLCRPNAWSISC
jgi:hypothetical protein